jgi:hypothetical protein
MTMRRVFLVGPPAAADHDDDALRVTSPSVAATGAPGTFRLRSPLVRA